MGLLFDTKKGFNKVSKNLLHATLEKIGLGTAILVCVMALYSCPTVQILASRPLVKPFPILNGTSQGGPTSLLLYILTMEHLVVAILSNPSILGIIVGLHKWLLYANLSYTLYSNYIIILTEFKAILRLTLINLISDVTVTQPHKTMLAIKTHLLFKCQSISLRYILELSWHPTWTMYILLIFLPYYIPHKKTN